MIVTGCIGIGPFDLLIACGGRETNDRISEVVEAEGKMSSLVTEELDGARQKDG
jgi:hypothetical protein